MYILINASNLKVGGGIQVADSLCGQLYRFPQHQFVVVLPSNMNTTAVKLLDISNIKVVRYDIRNNFSTLIFGRDNFLDKIVCEQHIHIVLTVFGPSRWNPKCMHLCGYAMPHLVIPDSPYFIRMNKISYVKTFLRNKGLAYYFRRGSRFFYTENPYISERLEKLIPKSTVYTISNYYNQVFDMPECWKRDCVLPPFDGITFLTITASYPHKNLAIAIDIAKEMKQQHSNFMFRFVFTVKEKDLPPMPQDLKKHFVFIGKVDITECPFLYEQSNIMFMPTLLECFTATYPEAMRMKCPIITTDLEFARGLCKNAAYYYDALSAESATEALYKVATNKELQSKLIVAGIEQLKMYDTYEQRADKLIEIMEQLVGSNKKIDNHVHL